MTAAIDMTPNRPIFILSSARSGSTLLRILLDTHPEIACPPESHLARICETLERTWRITHPGLGPVDPAVHPWSAIRATSSAPLDEYALKRGKRRWCEKSLDNVGLCDLLKDFYPDAVFVCLYRHAMDVVVSGLEAARWGFAAYGFESYVRESPGNTVQALIRYWCDINESLLAFEDKAPVRIARVRYEDLVRDPTCALSKLLPELGVSAQAGLDTEAFRSRHDLGSGDHKLPFTSSIQVDRIGSGRAVPFGIIPAGDLERMNNVLERLGYSPVHRNWNMETANIDLSIEPVAADLELSSVEAVRRIFGNRDVKLQRCWHVMEQETSTSADSSRRTSANVHVVFEDLRIGWCVDIDASCAMACDPDLNRRYLAMAVCTSGSLADIVSERANLGEALRSGGVRARGAASALASAIGVLQQLRSDANPQLSGREQTS